MDAPKGQGYDLSKAVSQATEHVQDRQSAFEEAAEQQKPKSSGTLLAVAGVVFLGVLAWDAYVLTRPPEVPSAAVQEEHLRFFVSDAVDLIEQFSAEQGRLPTRADLGDLLDEEISYEVRGEGFVVGMEGEGVSVEYDSRQTLADWMAFGPRAGGGGGAT